MLPFFYLKDNPPKKSIALLIGNIFPKEKNTIVFYSFLHKTG
jgi:hypothetical protein